MLRLLKLLFDVLVRALRTRRNLLLENLALRQQLVVLARRRPRPQFSNLDRWLWVMLRRLWPGWQRALILVQPDTVADWHKPASGCIGNGFRGAVDVAEEDV